MANITQTPTGQLHIDYMARDYDSLLLSMRELIPYKLPEWKTYESESDFGNVLLQLFAHMGDIINYYQDRVANESFLATAQNRSSVINHLKLIGYQLKTAAPASAMLTITLPTPSDNDIKIIKGNAFATKSQENQASVHFEYTRDVPLVIPKGITKAEIPVEEGWLIADEILGTSDGTPNQKLILVHSPFILRALGESQTVNKDIILLTHLEGIIDEWTLQETLTFSQADQKDFIIEIDEEDRATIIFGDGIFGDIPSNGATITTTYRVGGGINGNVPANTIETIVDAPQLTLLGAKVTNPQPATGGAERESIEHAVQQAPTIFRSLKRAVTAEDYKALALDFRGVGKVRAEATNWNTVILYVAPAGGGQLSDVLKANLLAYFEDKRQVSTILDIEDVTYVKIYITAVIGVKSYYDPDSVTEQVQQVCSDLLAFDNVDFGETLYLSRFYEAIETLDGLKYVTITEFRREDDSRCEEEQICVEPSGKIEMNAEEIPIAPNDEPDYVNGVKVLVDE